eukprot:2130141-Amphidinium_carterae.1
MSNFQASLHYHNGFGASRKSAPSFRHMLRMHVRCQSIPTLTTVMEFILATASGVKKSPRTWVRLHIIDARVSYLHGVNISYGGAGSQTHEDNHVIDY